MWGGRFHFATFIVLVTDLWGYYREVLPSEWYIAAMQVAGSGTLKLMDHFQNVEFFSKARAFFLVQLREIAQHYDLRVYEDTYRS